MSAYLSQVKVIVWKDFVTEFKTRELFSSMFCVRDIGDVDFHLLHQPQRCGSQSSRARNFMGGHPVCGNARAQPFVHAGKGKWLFAGIDAGTGGPLGNLFRKNVE